jgi:hypothetical protein
LAVWRTCIRGITSLNYAAIISTGLKMNDARMVVGLDTITFLAVILRSPFFFCLLSHGKVFFDAKKTIKEIGNGHRKVLF